MVRHRLRLVNDGQQMTVDVAYDSAAHIEEFYRRVADMLLAEQNAMSAGSVEAADAYGNAVMALYGLVLGAENAGRVQSFFGDNAVAMVAQVNTFIARYVQGDVDNCSARNRKRMQKQFLRQQRRLFR